MQKKILIIFGIIIIIGAVFTYQYFGKIKPEKNHQVSEIDSWKTYTNNEYGFEFKIPSDLETEEITPYVGPGLEGTISEVQFKRKNERGDIEQAPFFITMVENNSTNQNFFTIKGNSSNFILDGTEGKRFDRGPADETNKTTDILVAKDKVIYGFHCEYAQVPVKYDCPTLDKILPTFKFTK